VGEQHVQEVGLGWDISRIEDDQSRRELYRRIGSESKESLKEMNK
jgi:hypothetical protein